jgi:formylglycine-generating enzyme required for sulfatase activity
MDRERYSGDPVRRSACALRVLLAAASMTLIGAGEPEQQVSARASNDANRVWVEPVSGMELVYLSAGSFLMGTPEQEIGRESGEVLHPVVITHPFYMGRFEVTQGQWEAVMGTQPSHFSDCGVDCPVEGVSYTDIEDFVAKLSARSGELFRLPTEAEWEYACRAGTSTPYGVGENLTLEAANFDARLEAEGTFRGAPTPVGTFAPNPWGLYDMHGNVWEWCADWHCPYSEEAVEDPIAHCSSSLRVIRGGSWYFGSDSARCGLRYTHRPDDSGPSLGFRVVREIPAE